MAECEPADRYNAPDALVTKETRKEGWRPVHDIPHLGRRREVVRWPRKGARSGHAGDPSQSGLSRVGAKDLVRLCLRALRLRRQQLSLRQSFIRSGALSAT